MTKEDKQIAEKVMGWNYSKLTLGGRLWGDTPKGPIMEDDWSPTTDANDDCRVLEHIRENWVYPERQAWKRKLREIASRRMYPNTYELISDIAVSLYYEKGDYSLAALRVLSES